MWKSHSDLARSEGNVPPLPSLNSQEAKNVRPLAKRLHVQWGWSRLGRGFVYGPKRSETEHPGLVPFDELGELEETRDVEDAEMTLRTVKSLGISLLPFRVLMAFSIAAVVVSFAVGFVVGILN